MILFFCYFKNQHSSRYRTAEEELRTYEAEEERREQDQQSLCERLRSEAREAAVQICEQDIPTEVWKYYPSLSTCFST